MFAKKRLTLFIAVFIAAVSLIFAATAMGLILEEGDDPDRPPGVQGPFDEADYLLRREAFIALRRGNDPNKPLDPTARNRALSMLDRQVKALREGKTANQLLAFPNWLELGPNPIPAGQTQTTRVAVSGRISAIEIDPTDPNKVYVGAAQGGVYRSLNGGTTWTPIFDSAQTLAIGTLSLDPANGWLWVGTGEANGSADSFAGVGLYRIENVNTTADLVGPINPIRNYNDANNNPVSAGFFSGRSISKIIRVPGDPNTLFVGVAGGVIGIGGNTPLGNSLPPLAMRGLVRLSNVTGPSAGITGTRIAVSTTPLGGVGGGLCFDTPCTVNRSVNDMVLDPQDPSGNKLIVWLNGTNVAGDGGIYRSTNAMSGAPTFTQTLITTSTSTSNGRGELRAYQRSGTTVIYAASGEPSNNTGVGGATICNSASNFGALRRSDDGGATWTNKLQGGGGFCAGQCFYNIGFDVLPGAGTTTDKLLLGGNVRSTSCAKQQSTSLDGGATTFVNHDDTTHADTHVIKFAPSNPQIVYRGDDGGVWKSTNGGDTWLTQNNTTLRATQFQSVAVHPTDPDITIGGTQDNGTEKMVTGPTWSHSDDGDGGYAMIDQSTPTTMYHTYFNQTSSQIGYARSLNSGTSWSFLGCSGTGTTNGISCNPATTTAVNFYAPTALGPGSPNNTVYLGTDRLLRSSTQGTANVTVSQAPLVSGVAISAIAISPQDDNYRIVGLNNGALFFTTTGSSTLTNLDPTGAGSVIRDFYVARLAFDPTNKNTVYIALGNYAGDTTAANSHVWKVTNLNTTPVLTAINGSGINTLPDVPVNGFAVDPLLPSRLFAGTDIGVYVSYDSGGTWAPYGVGLPRVAVFDIVIQNVKRVLRIATHGRGMWEISLADCLITCPANITKPNDPNQCGAVVTYPAPTTTGGCGTVSCVPPSGSFFTVGSTTVTCSATGAPMPNCSFTVTVQDTQPPVITCPTNITTPNDPNQCGAVVSFSPTASDNCTGVTVTCVPAAGSFFPVGTTTVNCTASDASPNSPDATCSFAVTVTNVPPVLTYASPQTALVGQSTNITPATGPTDTNLDTIAVQSVVPPLGASISVNNTTGVVTVGPASQAGTYLVTIRATDKCGVTTDASFTLRLVCPTISVDPATLPGGTVGTGYNQTVTGTPASNYTYSVTSGSLPTGLTLNASTGVISGTPTLPGSFNFRVTATIDACSGFRDYTVVIACPTITLGAIANGVAGTAYNQTITVNPAGSYTFSLAVGNLPSGLTLNPTTGVISGSPGVTGTYNFTIKAEAANGCSGTQNYSLAISCPAITLSALPTPTLNTAYNQTVTATPAGGNYTFAVTGGALPPGLSLSGTGVLNGTVTTNGTYNFTITATGFGGCTSNRNYSFVLSGGCPTITLPASLPNGAVGQMYNQTVAASPAGTYTYTQTGNLPPGVNFINAAALLFGFPTTAGSYSFTITATDSNNCTGTQSYTVVIGATLFAKVGDFDGDGKSDLSVWRGMQSTWMINQSSNDQMQNMLWGAQYAPYNDVITPGDYDGDGKADVAVFRRGNGHWYIHRSSDGTTVDKYWGLGTDSIVPADYDGDGKTDIAVWRGSEGRWYIVRSSDGAVQTDLWGSASAPYNDVPVPADYDGDGKTDIAVFRRGNGHWYIKRSSDGVVVDKYWGMGTDVPVPADYDGDGKADIGIWRGSDTNWYIVRSSNDSVQIVSWGGRSYGDIPVPGDYDGDGKTDVAIWREPEGAWYVLCSKDGSVMIKIHGQPGDKPINTRQQ